MRRICRRMGETIDEKLAALRAERNRIGMRKQALNTRLNYACDWRTFTAWCREMEIASLPASEDTLGLYLTYRLRAGKISSMRRACSAITHYHRSRGHATPVTTGIKEFLTAAQRERAEKPQQKKPLRVEELRAISASLREKRSDVAMRDRALLVLGFATALRRSSLAALDLADVEFTADGVVIHVMQEKQDQLGHGRLIGVPYGAHPDTCASKCLREWLHKRGSDPGPLFWHVSRRRAKTRVTGEWVGYLVKKHAEALGLGEKDYAGHSLRSGFITAAGEAGLGEFLIASQTGHRSMEVLKRYFRRIELFRANAAGMIGL